MTIHFFGDSNAAGKKAVPASFYLEGLHKVANHAESGSKLVDVIAQVNAVSFEIGDVAVINGGINDLATGRTPGQVAADMEAILSAAPAWVIKYVLPIFPYSPYRYAIEDSNARIAPAFESLYDVLAEDGGLKPLYDSSDGLHLSCAGQRYVAFYLDLTVNAGIGVSSWIFDGDGVSLVKTPADCIDRRWHVWPKPIPTDGGSAYQEGYTGALAAWETPGDFTVDAEFSHSRSPTSFFSIVVNATAGEWVQIGLNFSNDHLFQIAHWKSKSFSRNLVEAFPVMVDVNLEDLGSDSFVENKLRVTVHRGRLYAFSDGGLIAECDLPPGLPGNAVGFWMRDCRLSRFDAGEADLTPNPK